jgi:hypothetical protein
MSARFINAGWNTPVVFPEDHPVHFIIEAIGQPDAGAFKVDNMDGGSEQYPPDG